MAKEEIHSLPTLEKPELDRPEHKAPFEHTPSSVPLDLMQKTMANHSDVKLMEARQAAISKGNKKFEVVENVDEGQIKVRQETDDYTTELTFFFQETKKLPQPAKKILRYVMTKIPEQAFSNKVLYGDKVRFPLKDIVDAGIYTNIESARTGFKAGAKALVNIAIEGEMKRGKGNRKESFKWSYGHLFRKASIVNGVCQIDLETENDWNFIIPNFEISPRYVYQLTNRSFDLAEALFYYARLRSNCKNIASKGYFELSLRVLQQRLALPEETPNPARDIKKPIIDCIAELNEREKETHNYYIEIEADKNASAKEWIETGHIKIWFYNEYLEQYKRYAEARSNKIEQAAKHKKEAKIQ
jgi:hypothetical protein